MTRLLGRTRYVAPGGKAVALMVKVNGAGRRALHRHTRAAVHVVVTARVAGADPVRRTFTRRLA